MVKDINEPAVFFLDAHPSRPEEIIKEALARGDKRFTTRHIISSELKVILSHHVKGHVIVIDDVNLKWLDSEVLSVFKHFNVLDKYNFILIVINSILGKIRSYFVSQYEKNSSY